MPKNWKILHKEFGDLNGDKKDDVVLILRANYAKYINKNDGFGENTFDTNPQMLVILFKTTENFELIEQNNTFIISREFPTQGEPFQKIVIKNGVLQLFFEQWQSAGSWETSNTTYKFKFINDEFNLIGLDTSSSMRNAGEVTTLSYNFLTKKLKMALSTYANETPYKITWKNIKISKLKTFKTYKAPYTWKIGKDKYL
ncbi:MAG: hypothetical protein MUC29_04775 [Pyrinomonadaceae bacterium]|nr:hypothetical protein [Pyrinomonadaceae bacterium]